MLFNYGRIWPDRQETIDQMANYCTEGVCTGLVRSIGGSLFG
jgi:hypothetical protein